MAGAIALLAASFRFSRCVPPTDVVGEYLSQSPEAKIILRIFADGRYVEIINTAESEDILQGVWTCVNHGTTHADNSKPTITDCDCIAEMVLQNFINNDPEISKKPLETKYAKSIVKLSVERAFFRYTLEAASLIIILS